MTYIVMGAFRPNGKVQLLSADDPTATEWFVVEHREDGTVGQPNPDDHYLSRAEAELDVAYFKALEIHGEIQRELLAREPIGTMH